MCVEGVWLVDFPDLVSEGVLESVAALFAESVGPYVAVVDGELRLVAELVEDVADVLVGGLPVGGRASVALCCRADVA